MYQFPHPDEILNSAADLLAFARISADQLRQPDQSLQDVLAALRAAEEIQPVRVTRHFARRIEPGIPRDPLLLQTLPPLQVMRVVADKGKIFILLLHKR